MDAIIAVGNGLDGSLTGTGRLEVILVGVIVVLAAVLVLVRYLRNTNHKRRKGASAYFDKNAANKGSAGRGTSTGTATYPASGSSAPQTLAPSFAAPRKGASRQDGSPTQGRPPSTDAAPRTPAAPAATTAPGLRTPVRSPVLDPVPPLRTEGIAMPPDKGASATRPTASNPGPGPEAAPSSGATSAPSPAPAPSPTSARTAVPANLPPLTPPPPTAATSIDGALADGPTRTTSGAEPESEPDGDTTDDN